MAKRRRKRTHRRTRTRTRTRTVTRYRTRAPARRRRRRGGSRGGGHSLMPPKHELYDMAGAAAYGFLEGEAKKDANFFLNKLPKPITPLGYAGNVAIAARLANHFFVRSPLLGSFARGVACVAAYQIARQGKLFDNSEAVPTISGDDDDIAGELDDSMMGALAAEGEGIYGDDDDDIGDANETMSGDEEIPVLGLDEED